MSTAITLKSFPFDSMNVLNEESNQMEPDRLYEAEIFRKYFAKFLSNGVYFGHYNNYGENSMKVTADGGLNIRIAKGAGLIEGADFENETERVITLERPISGNRVDRVVIRFDKGLSNRNTYLLIKKGSGTTPSTLQRDENIYEICLAEVTVKSSANIVQTDIADKRTNKDLCGIVNSLISIDGEELYQSFKDYIDTASNSFVRKDKTFITLEGSMGAIWIDSKATIKLNYPEGFNFENCSIIGCNIGNLNGDDKYHYFSSNENFNEFVTEDEKWQWERYITMKEDGIHLTVKNLEKDASVALAYKVTLLKYK